MRKLRDVINESIRKSNNTPKSRSVKEGKGNEIVTAKTFKEVEKILKSKEAERIVYDAFGDDKKNAELFLKYSISDGTLGFLRSYQDDGEFNGQATMSDLLNAIDIHIEDSEAEIPFNFTADWAVIPGGGWDDDIYDKAKQAARGLSDLLADEFDVVIK